MYDYQKVHHVNGWGSIAADLSRRGWMRQQQRVRVSRDESAGGDDGGHGGGMDFFRNVRRAQGHAQERDPCPKALGCRSERRLAEPFFCGLRIYG